MLKLMQHVLPAILLISGLYGCGAGVPGSLPPERPQGVIGGKVLDGNVSDTRIFVYDFSEGVRGQLLGDTKVDEAGIFTIALRSPDRPVLVEARGGSYIEQATGAEVELFDEQVLRAVGKYESGKNIDISISPFTHFAAGLSQFKVKNNIEVEQAITEAYSELNLLFNIEIDKTAAAPISKKADGESTLNDEFLYGFYLAGISNFTLWASNKNLVTPHTVYTSIYLSQIIYADISADGLLDGIGVNADTSEPMPLSFGMVSLDSETYRRIFSLHMLAIANSSENKTEDEISALNEAADAMAGASQILLGENSHIDIDAYLPELALVEAVLPVYSGTLSFDISVSGFLGAEFLVLYVDDFELNKKNTPSNSQVNVIIDTTDFEDGKHTIKIEAVDALGKSGSLSFEVFFDNTNPVVAVTSPAATKEASLEISGLYADNVSGVALLLIQGNEASLNEDGTWRSAVELEPGDNTIPIEIVDGAGNRRFLKFTLRLDAEPPAIDSLERHSLVQFSATDNELPKEKLQDDNTTPFYVQADKLALRGISITREELDNNQIPYFAFGVTDKITPTLEADAESISVQMQYEINNEVISPWRKLIPVNGEYLIPLTLETLSADWANSTPTDIHAIKVASSDSVGNITTKLFTFKLGIKVPQIEIDQIIDQNESLFGNTLFADRGLLNELDFVSTSYVFTNQSSQPYWISLADDSQHSTQQVVEQTTSSNRVEIQKTTEWRVGYMDPTDTKECPGIIDPLNEAQDAGGWSPTTSILNWNGSDWVVETPPVPVTLEESILADTLPETDISAWQNIPDFDEEYAVYTKFAASKLFNYVYDYIPAEGNNSVAYVSDWVYVSDTRNNGENTKVCDPKSYLQQRVVSEYRGVSGYPKTNTVDVNVTDTPSFSTYGFKLTDNDTGLELEAENGWYLIPVNHQIVIDKIVRTPQLALNAEVYQEYDAETEYNLSLSDKSSKWYVNRHLKIFAVHGVDANNLDLMPKNEVSVGSGNIEYSINR